MNGPLRKVSIFVAFMMAALLVNVTWISVVRSDDLNSEPRNRRVRDAEFASDRGAILVGNTPIAITNPAEGNFPFARTYPEGPIWSSVTGWYSYDYARSELERQYNEELSGTGLMLTLCEEHQEMVDAALDRDPERMEAVVARHIGHVRSVWAGHPGDE